VFCDAWLSRVIFDLFLPDSAMPKGVNDILSGNKAGAKCQLVSPAEKGLEARAHLQPAVTITAKGGSRIPFRL
jgi:hypothetical protein